MPINVEFVSASNGGAYNNSTGTITWDIGSLAPESYGSTNLTIGIPQNVTVGTVITNNANISTSNPDYNKTQTYTNVTQIPLSKNVTVGTVIMDNANISTSSPGYNETQAYTTITQVRSHKTLQLYQIMGV